MTASEPLDAFATSVLAVGTAPALAVAITDAERTLTARTYGAAEPDALWPVASIGKAFTAIVALQLAEEGALDLHAPIPGYVPWLTFGTPDAPITLHHLLTHTAGVVESLDTAPASTYDVVTLPQLDLGFAPGEHRHYSNIGYRAVGVVLEAVTGEPYGDLLQRRILDRLALTETVPVMLNETRRRLPGGHVPFYDDRPWRAEHGLAPAPWVESAEADGCLCASVEDLAAFLRALWNDDPRLLGTEGFAALRTPYPPHEDYDYGYGLTIEADGFSHTGDMLGYVAYMRADTTTGRGVVAFANGFRGAYWLGEGALALATGREPEQPALAHAEPLEDDGSCPPEWSALPGRYRAHNPWLPTFAIAARDGVLTMGTDWVDGSRRIVLHPIEPGLFRAGEEPWSPERLRFDTVLDGHAQRAVLSGHPYYRAFTS